MSTPRQTAARARKAVASVRRKTALALRCEGLTFVQIGAKLGFTEQAAHKAVQRELAAVAAERRELAEHQLDFELSQIDSVIRGMAPKAEKGDAKAGAVILKAMERRAKLLGLDAPEKHEIGGLNTDPQAIHARLGALATRATLASDPGAVGDPDGDGAG